MKSKKLFKDALMLFIITVIAGGLLGFVNDLTREPIKQQEIIKTQQAYQSLFNKADDFKETKELTSLVKDSSKLLESQDLGKNGVTINGALEAYDGDSLLGYIILSTSGDGYGGNIDLSIGIDKSGKITGIEILSIDETVGLGMNAQNEKFRNQYINKKVDNFKVVKTGKQASNEIDALSGATITSNAFTNAVNGALLFYQGIGG